MGPIEAMKSGFTKTFQFSGRATRAEYWWYCLSVFGTTVVCSSIVAFLFPKAFAWSYEIGFYVLNLALISVTLRRFFDRSVPKIIACILAFAPIYLYGLDLLLWGVNGFEGPQLIADDLNNPDNLRPKILSTFSMAALYAISACIGLAMFVLALLPSTPSTNQYGPNPTEVPS